MLHGLVKDSALVYAGTKLTKKTKKQTSENPGIFTDAFKKKVREQIEAFIANKEIEIQERKTKVTK